uniref:NADH-ubiquinone oxidoreductase chain 2 n=1 Tax=Lyophyllum shimeji TaxID=47721 RepID=A0A2Z4HH02_LYOSH|nr:NADH dehydrogenase subunit 2 [Lyophyllum shimeji]AWW14116.1 NADH dehydrogenase subunit 2 [Lyophyllum shimeji]
MIFISILTLIVAKALPSINSNLSSVYFTRISAIVFIYAGVLSFNTLYIQSIGSGIGIYSGLFQVTVISQFIEVFLLVIGSLILIAWPLRSSLNYISLSKDENLAPSGSVELSYSTDFSLIVLFSTLGSCLLVSTSDLVSMYLSIELQSFGLYVLATLYRNSESSTRAGLKYFLLGGLSSCLILLGAGLIYAYTGLTNFESIYSLISVSEVNNIIQGASLGAVLIIIGFLFKIAAAPLHNWSPDVYDETPTIVTIWLTIMPKISILILLLELHTQIGVIGPLNSITINLSSIQENSIYLLKNLLLISSLLSLIIGTVVGLAQTRIKRLLAYSTISHIGFILLALAINTEQSIDSLLFYIIQYSITNLDVFLIIIALSYIINNSYLNEDNDSIKDIRYISELKGKFFLAPLLSLSLSICLFSMAGIPPLIGFFSKQFVLYSAIGSGYYFMSIICIIVSVISASYYLKIIKVLHTEVEEDTKLLQARTRENLSVIRSYKLTENKYTLLSNFHSFLISTLTLSILFFIFKPSLILNSTQLLSLSLFNF